uniref:MULE transposase domain-containing protein n=1 Tax=Lactuca sativa TaxID=4236 RepID=A0A9R1W051_LACSA|nr:hypothetical protein LSAT_V11C400181220 [Lactuca sativa]
MSAVVRWRSRDSPEVRWPQWWSDVKRKTRETMGRVGLEIDMNDCDFSEFLEDINGMKRLDVYVDHHHEPLFDWIQEEEVDLEDDDLVSIDDVDSILEDEDHNAIRPIYPRHDHTQEWNEMKPRLGMKYSTTAELNYSLSCYTVANGNDMRYEKNDKTKIRRANPGSHVKVFLEPQPDNTVVFDRFYVSFKDVVDGWLDGCRKVIGIDGCFLKGVCRGELLLAVGRDANNNIYPLAWATVNVENKQTYKWFLDNPMEYIGGGNGHGITILSDGHKGLFEAVNERLLDEEHRLCARHIQANFHKKFKGEQYFKPFWRAVNATTVPKFEAAMNEMKSLESRAYDYLIDKDPRCWSKIFLERKQKGLSWDLDICPSIRREIEDLKELQRFWVPYVSGYKEFEVFSGNESSEWQHVEGHHTIFPPLRRRLPGRLCVKRKRDKAERELSGHTRHTVSRACIPLRCTICHQTGHNKATCPTRVKRTPMKKALVKKAPVKRSPMKKVPFNDAGRVRKFLERITKIGLQKNVKVKDGTGCSQDTHVTLE